MRKLFGTDGIRGLAGEDPLDADTIYRLGRGLASLSYRQLVIGRDTRASGPWIEEALVEGLEDGGALATVAGVITTPGLSHLCRSAPFAAGLMISASHNPYHDNGVKIFDGAGLKLSDSQEAKLEKLLEKQDSTPTHSKVREAEAGEITYRHQELVGRYVRFLRNIPQDGTLRGLRVVVDCAHGAAYEIAGEVLDSLGCEVTRLGHEPDGFNINLGHGALHPGQLTEAVRRVGADLGMAFDGDADRIILSDEEGRIVDGDHSLYILARQLLKQQRLPTRTVVTTVMANVGLEVALQRDGIQTLRTQVGDRYVLAEMLRGDHVLGGEQSGHTIIRSLSPAGDGIQTGLKIAETMVLAGEPLSRLCQGLEKFPQILINVQVREKKDFSEIPEIQQEIESTRKALGRKGRVVIRYSGTEPLARVMIEGEEEQAIQAYAESIAGTFRRQLG